MRSANPSTAWGVISAACLQNECLSRCCLHRMIHLLSHSLQHASRSLISSERQLLADMQQVRLRCAPSASKLACSRGACMSAAQPQTACSRGAANDCFPFRHLLRQTWTKGSCWSAGPNYVCRRPMPRQGMPCSTACGVQPSSSQTTVAPPQWQHKTNRAVHAHKVVGLRQGHGTSPTSLINLEARRTSWCPTDLEPTAHDL